jgi:thiol-disulfide isomerase/thioredoxin
MNQSDASLEDTSLDHHEGDASSDDSSREDAFTDANLPNETDTCVAQCEPGTCREDGCGQICPCGANEVCTEEALCVEHAICPPSEPFSHTVGGRIPNVRLMSCDGEAFELHDLCEYEAAWLMTYADWCPNCRRFAQNAERLFQAYQAEGLAMYVVITENASFAAPDAEECAAIRATYGLTMPVLYDAEGLFQDTLQIPANDQHIILRRGSEIAFKARYPSEMEIREAIENLL